MSTNDGGSAFPSPAVTTLHAGGGYSTAAHRGLTIRDWFAGQAISGLIGCEGLKSEHLALAAGFAFRLADMMLAERAKNAPR